MLLSTELDHLRQEIGVVVGQYKDDLIRLTQPSRDIDALDHGIIRIVPAQRIVRLGSRRAQRKTQNVHQSLKLFRSSRVKSAVRGHLCSEAALLGLSQQEPDVLAQQWLATGEVDEANAQFLQDVEVLERLLFRAV